MKIYIKIKKWVLFKVMWNNWWINEKIYKALDNPIMKNDLLLSYKCISNLEQKEIEKPIKIISDKIEFK